VSTESPAKSFSHARIRVVTLGVHDLARARAFYLDGLGCATHPARAVKNAASIPQAGCSFDFPSQQSSA
jgi:hypothetical protein